MKQPSNELNFRLKFQYKNLVCAQGQYMYAMHGHRGGQGVYP